jgi:hypothetical protein
MSFDDAASLPVAAFSAYMRGLPARMAELKLMLSEVIAMPYLEAEDRKTMIARWKEDAGIQEETVQPATPAVLALMGIGVRHA